MNGKGRGLRLLYTAWVVSLSLSCMLEQTTTTTTTTTTTAIEYLVLVHTECYIVVVNAIALFLGC
jgi:hypothetical protein